MWWLAACDSDERRLAGHGVARVEDLGTRVSGRGARAVHPLFSFSLVVEPQKNHRWTVSMFGPQNLGAAGLPSLGHKTWAEDGFPIWASKPGCCGFAEFGPQNSGYGGLVSRFGPQNRGLIVKVWFPGFGHKTGGGVREEDAERWRHVAAIGRLHRGNATSCAGVAVESTYHRVGPE